MKLLNNLKNNLKHCNIIYLFIIVMLIIAILNMFISLNQRLSDLHDDVRVIIRGNEAQTCAIVDKIDGQVIMQCSTPNYNNLKNNLYR